MYLIIILYSLIQITSATSFANDGFSAIATGGIVLSKTEDISMEDEVLTISTKNISVEYEFKNHTNKEIEAVISFPIPPIHCGHWAKGHDINDFTAKVNGEDVKTEREMKAIMDGKDITDKILKNKLTVDCNETYNDKEKFKLAQKLKLADDYQGTDPEDVLYDTQITYFWKQKFKPNETLKISHQYTPIYGSGLGYCPYERNGEMATLDEKSKNLKSNIKISTKMNPIDCVVVDYVLTTANTWKGPIKKFLLKIPTENLDLIRSNYGPLVLNKDKSFAQIEFKDFVPNEELIVSLYYNKKK